MHVLHCEEWGISASAQEKLQSEQHCFCRGSVLRVLLSCGNSHEESVPNTPWSLHSGTRTTLQFWLVFQNSSTPLHMLILHFVSATPFNIPNPVLLTD